MRPHTIREAASRRHPIWVTVPGLTRGGQFPPTRLKTEGEAVTKKNCGRKVLWSSHRFAHTKELASKRVTFQTSGRLPFS